MRFGNALRICDLPSSGDLGAGEIQHLQARHPSQVNESGIGDPRTVELKILEPR